MNNQIAHYSHKLKEIMEDILINGYPNFSNTCTSFEKEVLMYLESPSIEDYMNFIQSIKSESESIYYKEKLILFPRLVRRIETLDIEEKSASLDRIEESLNKITSQINSFFDRNLLETNLYLSKDVIEILSLQIEQLKKSWQLLLLKKQNLKNEVEEFRKLIIGSKSE